MQEHEHVIDVLQKVKEAAKNEDVVALNELSNQTIHSSAIYQDTDNILVAVVVYSLAKLIQRKHSFPEKVFNKYFKYYLDTIEFSKVCVEKNDCDIFRNRVQEMSDVPGLSNELKNSVKEVFRKARINKASKIYEHGISMQATAKLLGISIWELADYVGQGNISDYEENKTEDIKKRAKIAMEIFEK